MAALLVLAIERLLPSPGALPSPILAATHTCFIRLRTLGPQLRHRELRIRARRENWPAEPYVDTHQRRLANCRRACEHAGSQKLNVALSGDVDEEPLLEFFQAVAQLRRTLEFQIARGVEHIFFHVLDFA